jgi:hypothetical protein
MATLRIMGGELHLNLTARDTHLWAHRRGAKWPCSVLAGRRVYACFDRSGDLIDVRIDGGRGDQDCPADEFNAITQDFRAKVCK